MVILADVHTMSVCDINWFQTRGACLSNVIFRKLNLSMSLTLCTVVTEDKSLQTDLVVSVKRGVGFLNVLSKIESIC